MEKSMQYEAVCLICANALLQVNPVRSCAQAHLKPAAQYTGEPERRMLQALRGAAFKWAGKGSPDRD
jgi:hypothetical protein